MCLASLDAKLVERGTAATPGSVPMIGGAVALIQRIRYFRGDLKSGAKVTFLRGSPERRSRQLTAILMGAGSGV